MRYIELMQYAGYPVCAGSETSWVYNVKKNKNNLVWVDCEMTGLNPDVHSILEIAVLVTDGRLRTIVEGPDLVICHSDAALSVLEPWSLEHHTKSGLLDRVRSSDLTMAEAERKILDFIRTYCEEGQSPLCGNSVSYDRRFLQKQMPGFNKFLSHPHIDVSTVKELVRHWYPAGYLAPEGKEEHRAMTDIRESIAELKHYRKHVFIRPVSKNIYE